MKTLVIYVFHQFNQNVEFFLKFGVFQDPSTDFLFVINSLTEKIPQPPPYARVVNRENVGHDFGGWSHGLFLDDNHKKYQSFVLLNSTVRGPFLPVWDDGQKWTKHFLDLLSESVALAGTTIGIYKMQPHVQSMLLAFDQRALEIGISSGIFTQKPVQLPKDQVIIQKEVGFSTAVLKKFNIACLLTAFKGVDFRNYQGNINGFSVFSQDAYFGIDPHPYEVIFPKDSSHPSHQGRQKVVMAKLTNWKMNPGQFPVTTTRNLLPKNFNWQEYLRLNPDVSKVSNTKAFAEEHYLKHGSKEGRSYVAPIVTTSSEQLPKDFDWREYLRLNPSLLKMGINENFARNHYLSSGRRLGLIYKESPRGNSYFLIDLNPLHLSGLFNELISLINGILLGHLLNRQVVVNGFYPDYNQPRKISLGKVVDINGLNKLISEKGLRTKIIDGFENTEQWPKSKHLNPTKKTYVQQNKPGCLDQLIRELSEERNVPRVDISDVFSYSLFRQNPDETLRKLYTDLLLRLPFTNEIMNIVETSKQQLKLDNYSSLHLRVEDDIIRCRPDKKITYQQFADKIQNKYRGEMAKTFTPDEKVYVSTFLLKGPNTQNAFLPELKNKYRGLTYWEPPEVYWRKSFPNFPLGREIDGLIDYLLCLGGKKFLGYNGSTFSENIKYHFEREKKSFQLL